MKLHSLHFGLLLAVLLIPSLVHAQSAGAGPRLSFNESVHDFGLIEKGTSVDHRFEFVNTGSSMLLISEAALSCPCFSVDWRRGPVMPGDTGWVIVSYPLKHNGPFDEMIWLSSNAVNIDPRVGRYELRIKGNIMLKGAAKRGKYRAHRR